MDELLDLKNKRFGRLVVTELGPKYESPSKKSHDTRWYCKCDCGNTVLVKKSNLLSGNTVSCGCYKKEKTKDMRKKSSTYNSNETKYRETAYILYTRGMLQRDIASKLGISQSSVSKYIKSYK